MPDTVSCPTCARIFGSLQALGAHRFRAHGYRKTDDLVKVPVPTVTSSAADVTIAVGPSVVVDQADELTDELEANTVTVVLDDHEHDIARALVFLNSRADVEDVIADLITDTLATYADDFDVQRLLEIRDGR